MQAIHFSSMRIEIEKSVSSQPASQSVFYFFMLLDDGNQSIDRFAKRNKNIMTK